MLTHLLIAVSVSVAGVSQSAPLGGGQSIDPITGTVYSTTGSPIAGATIEFGERLHDDGGELPVEWHVIAAATTTANGSFSLGRQYATTPGPYRDLLVSAPGFVSERLMMQCDKQHPQRFYSEFYRRPLPTGDCALVPARQLRGSVRDPNGNPIAGVKIVCVRSQSKTVSDDNGKFTLEGVPDYSADLTVERSLLLDVSHPDYISMKTDLPVNTQDATLTMNPGVLIEGTVREQETGKGTASGFRVFGSAENGFRDSVRVGPEGHYQLRFPPGKIVLNVVREWTKNPLANNYVAVKPDTVIFVADGETRSDVDLEVTKGHIIRGHLEEAISKEPVAATYVSIVAVGARKGSTLRKYFAETDADGQFAACGIPAGSYSLENMPHEDEVHIRKASVVVLAGSDPEPVELTAIRRIVANGPELEPLVMGRVVFADGRPATLATVTARPDRPVNGKTQERGRTLPDGSFGLNLSDMAGSGEFRAFDVANKLAGVVSVPDLPAAQQPVVITLGKGATFSGTVRDQSGKPLPGVSVVVGRSVPSGDGWARYELGRGFTGADGRYTTTPYVPSSRDAAVELRCNPMRGTKYVQPIKPEGAYANLNVSSGAHTDGLDFALVIDGNESYFAAKPAEGGRQ